jgi:uncharacterized membrane protein
MNKQSYLASLKRSLSGLPADQVADILGDYEQHFVDAMARGRGDAETARALGDPRKIALEFKAMTHLDAFQKHHSLVNFTRMAFTFICVAGFNLFLLPFMLVAPVVLVSLYFASLCCFGGGAVLAASGLLRIDKITVERDGRQMALVVGKQADRIRAGSGEPGIQVWPYAITYAEELPAGERAEAIGGQPSGQGIKALIGALYIGAGIALFLLSQKLAGYLGAGARRYLNANVNILRGAQAQRA